VDDGVKAAETIRALLGNLATVAQRMAELRNPYGTGHGKAAKASGLQPRHARLAVGAAGPRWRCSCSRLTKISPPTGHKDAVKLFSHSAAHQGNEMAVAHRHLLGAYRTPRFQYGASVMCEVRGEVIITGLTNARIPWPIAKRPGSRGRSLAVFGDLTDAVRRESVSAICYWWGITAQTVTKWRREMGVGAMTEGTVRLKVASATDSMALAAARERGKAKPVTLSGVGRLRRPVGGNHGRGTSSRPCGRAGRASRTPKKRGRRCARPPVVVGRCPRKRVVPGPRRKRPCSAKSRTNYLRGRRGRKVSAVVKRRQLLRIEKYSPWD